MQNLLPYLFLINALGLLLMRMDKQKAKRDQFRIPEAVLLAIALLGGSLGAVLGMLVFHHKTKKPLFSIGLPMILLVHIAIFLL